MAVLKKYNLAGQEVGEVVIEEGLVKAFANPQMVKDYIVALRANARQWSASTKGRAAVNHSGKKPHPQKGTGRARQGYLGAPQYKGGGRVHAPLPKFDQHVRINRKERRAAVSHLLAEKIQGNRLHVLEFEGMAQPKTKVVAEFLRQRALTGKRVLFVGEEVSSVLKFGAFVKSLNNISGSAFALMPNLSGYDVLLNHEIVLMSSALDQLKVLLGGQA